MIRIIQRLYHSITLNLGIKRCIESAFRKTKTDVDIRVFYPLYRLIGAYFFNSEIAHYGADYRWGDEKSQNLDIKHRNYGYGLMQYALVRNLRPKRVLCVGSMYGYIPYMLAKACMENGSGHVDFVDAAFDFNDKKYKTSHYFGQGFWNKVNVSEHFSYLLQTQYISTHVMTLEEFLHKDSNHYEYIYLDGDHSYKGLVRDIRLIWPRLAVGGILGLHDIEFDFKKSLDRIGGVFRRKVEHVTFGVARVWREFEKTSQTLPVLNGYSGLGFIFKRNNSRSSLPDFLQ